MRLYGAEEHNRNRDGGNPFQTFMCGLQDMAERAPRRWEHDPAHAASSGESVGICAPSVVQV
jgi:hypothetical protein